MFIDPENRYFYNSQRPIYEIYQLLPEFKDDFSVSSAEFQRMVN